MNFTLLAVILIIWLALLVWMSIHLLLEVRALNRKIDRYRDSVNELQRARQGNAASKRSSSAIPHVDSKPRVVNRPQPARGAKQSTAVHREKSHGNDPRD